LISHTEAEIASQPGCWARAQELAATLGSVLPARGARVAVVGCGTSWFVAQAYAALREGAGHGETDAFAASEMPVGRRYDRVLAISRSGTTTEVLTLLTRLDGRVAAAAITADPGSPVARAAGRAVGLPFADEASVVQTRFATTTLALLRVHLGLDLAGAIADAHRALSAPLPEQGRLAEQVTFLGQGWAYGLAQEAALKLREAAGGWAEAYPAMEYRHGPISIAGPGRVVWVLGAPPPGLVAEIERAGGIVVDDDLDPLADLVRVQRLAVAMARARGLDPDRPRNLTRSVILAPATN
jgi:fructoselysine-6-P-deglycase FrlB-like protein